MKHAETFLKAFENAINGLIYFFAHGRNGRIQLVIAMLTIIVSFILSISPAEWIVILICIAIVLSLEMLNSALEKMCDIIHPGYHPIIKIIKDVAAASVLWSSVLSAVIGSIILLPKIIKIL